tara:strand:+ start:5790 stop:6245 length:456 start_codon:yes stop_codon:yes gene_type:complete
LVCDPEGERRKGRDNVETDKPKLSYWTIAALGLVWNLMGCLNFIAQSNPEAVAQMPEVYGALIASRPAWATAAFAVAVFGGAVGCILLLMQRRVAVQVLMLSLGAIALTLLYALITAGFSPQILTGTGMSLLIGGVLLWMARLAARSGWLR